MIGIAAPTKDTSVWVEAIKSQAPEIPVSVWPDLSADTVILLCWNPPIDVFDDLPNLRAICAMGAGLDALVTHPKRPKNIPLLRLKNNQLANDMSHHVMHCIESWRLNIFDYVRDQHTKTWSPRQYKNRADVTVTVLGLGHIGAYVAEKLATEGYMVRGWSSTPKHLADVETFSNMHELKNAVSGTDVLVCLLALNESTDGILDEELFQQMRPNGCLINVARGGHLHEKSLLRALEGSMKMAWLDVFNSEPLVEDHPFWAHTRIIMTPHIASLTDPNTAAGEIISYYLEYKR